MQALIPSAAVAVLLLAGTAAAQGVPKEPSPIRFDNMRLLVSRFDETFVFYRDVLGLTPTWGKPGDNYASFAFPGGAQIALFRRSLMAEAIGTTAEPATRRVASRTPDRRRQRTVVSRQIGRRALGS